MATTEPPSSSKRPRLAAEPSNVIGPYAEKHNESTAKLIKTIDLIAAAFTGSQGSNEDTAHLLEDAAIHFINLRESQRQASLLIEEKAEQVRKRRSETEAGNLILQNLLYEKTYVEREIATCRDCPTKELAKMACEEEGEDVTAVSQDQVHEIITQFLGRDINQSKDRDTHQFLLNFIAQEMKDRENLKAELEQVKQERTKVETESESKRRFLSSLPNQLDVLEKATLPLQEYLKLRSSERKTRFARAKKLSRPLYILCCQLETYADAFGGDDMNVEVVDAVQYTPKMTNPTSTDNAAAEETQDQETIKNVLQPDPFAVLLKLRSVKSRQGASTDLFETVIRFQFITKLNIVTAEATGNPRLLINLFPGDTGDSLPNLSTYHDLSLNAHSSIIGSDEFPGRPFLWAQWLAGLLFLPDEQSERLEPSTKVVIRQLLRRVRAQGVLKDLLAALANRPNPIPIHPSFSCLNLHSLIFAFHGAGSRAICTP